METIAKNQSNTLIHDDAVAQVLGKEHRGRVRGLGSSITPTKVNAAVTTKYTTMKLEEKVKNLEQLVMTLLNNNVQTNDGVEMEGRVQHASTHMPSVSSRQQGSNNDAQQSSSKNASEQDISNLKGKKCNLLHWIGNGEIVAEVEIDCIDSSASLHHMLLGPDHWRVTVTKILVSKVPLIRPTSDLHILEDTRGTYIAWPTKYITY